MYQGQYHLCPRSLRMKLNLRLEIQDQWSRSSGHYMFCYHYYYYLWRELKTNPRSQVLVSDCHVDVSTVNYYDFNSDYYNYLLGYIFCVFLFIRITMSHGCNFERTSNHAHCVKFNFYTACNGISIRNKNKCTRHP